MKTIRIGLAQINSIVGDLKGNSEKIIAKIEEATKLGVDLVAFPELALTGYPPEDLLLKPSFIERNIEYLNELAKQIKNITAVIGFVDSNGDIFNAAAIINDREILGVYHKIYLPNYGVFDEERYFCGGKKPCIIEIGEVKVGISVCEDMWYPEGPALVESLKGAEVIININASPFHLGKWRFREKMLAVRASDNRAIVAYVNMVGGQDELVFDGHSLVVNEKGETIARGKPYEEDLLVVDLDVEAVFRGRLHDPRRRKKIKRDEKTEGIEEINVEIPEKTKSKPVSGCQRCVST